MTAGATELEIAQADTGTEESTVESAVGISPALVRIMAIGCGLSVANLYYNQPLLADIGRSFHASVRQLGVVSLLTQIGYALGMLVFVPLGDITERRRLIVGMLVAVAAAMAGAALAPGLGWMCAASLLIGMTTIVPQLLVPFAAQLAPPAERGRVVGSVMSGLLIGILLARTISGLVGGSLGWRAMYALGALMMVALAVAMRAMLPRREPSTTLSYSEALRSLPGLIRGSATLREAALIGGLLFGAFSAFWTTLVFLLEGAPYHYHLAGQAAGLFGLVGVVGAGAAPLAGRLADRRSPRLTVGLGVCITFASYLVFRLAGGRLFGLIAGVILLDFGVQATHISNQTRIYRLPAHAHNRLNTIYMVTYFLGGSLGSALGAQGWSRAGWPGVCAVGLGLTILAILVYLVGRPPEETA